MFKDEFQAVANAGKNKLNFMKNNPLGYFISAMVAGMFIGLGGLISFTTVSYTHLLFLWKIICYNDSNQV